MKFDFAVVGATGMQGKIVSRDLLESGYSVLLCGRDKSRVEHLLKNKKTKFAYLDLRDIPASVKILKDSGAKVMVNCAEGDWDVNAMKISAQAGLHSIDLGSDAEMTEEQLKFSKELEKKNLIHITGCGSVPGIGNVMLRYVQDKFDSIETIKAGFAWDSNIKEFVVPFSIQSILEEFTTPAPYIKNGKIVTVAPKDSIELKYHRAIGKQKQMKVGHHPEPYTFYKYCKDKGVKNIEFYAGFPEHSAEKIWALVELGFASEQDINFRGSRIDPGEFLTEVLKRINYPQGYTETENLWVFVEGKKEGRKKKVLMECIVPPLKGWEDAGCNIDTGMPASIIAQMIYRGEITSPGAFAPENIVPVKPFFKELAKRKMVVYENGKRIN